MLMRTRRMGGGTRRTREMGSPFRRRSVRYLNSIVERGTAQLSGGSERVRNYGYLRSCSHRPVCNSVGPAMLHRELVVLDARKEATHATGIILSAVIMPG